MHLFEQFGDLLIRYGPKALEAMARITGEQAAPLDRLVQQGLLVRYDRRLSLTERAVRELERGALAEAIGRLNAAEGNAVGQPGDDEPVSEAEILQAVGRSLAAGPACPLDAGPADIGRYLADCRESLSLALLVDMSYSMSRFGRFVQAKRIAMALHALVRDHAPADSLDVIGFYSLAERIAPSDLPLLMPKPVSLLDRNVSVRVPLGDADQVPQQFTNLQMALRLARQTLARRCGQNKHVFIVLDGEPTAFVDGDQLVLRYPPDAQTASATLAEAQSLARADCRLATFALIDDYYYMDWVGFVDRLTRLVRGVSFYCGSSDLGACVLESYVAGKRPQPSVHHVADN